MPGLVNTPTPFSTEFMSLRWRQLFRYAVEQAALRDIEIGLNLCDGWNSGGSWITEALAINQGERPSNQEVGCVVLNWILLTLLPWMYIGKILSVK